ncbi:DUF2461 family protein [Pedobacter sp. CFBP9032]|uniref:DUF2461 family protein n=1 Tax=Pedobacter sp. CFBP9032 TaxID=3096539 RepID=UPI002A6A55DA|nr:DUF2461 family protein [Pedobacter sp. CFBP9032]MDY0904818.1 DUF2461 family protein [Pedobacter sp. CFBP9032]
MEKTLEFLLNLKSNNNQTWFMDHIGEYERAKTEIGDLAYLLLEQLSPIDTRLNDEIEVERFISNLINFKPKKAITYNAFFEISISPLANDGNEPVYLVHIEPGLNYISVKYDPDIFGLQVMRSYISKHADEFDRILKDTYSSGFTLVQSSSLSALPKGYPVGIPGEAYIKLQQYELKSPIELLKTKDELIRDITLSFSTVLPIIQFLRNGLGL